MTEPSSLVNGTTPWYHLRDIVAVLEKFTESTWLQYPRLKYLGLRVDTRTKEVLLTDRKGTPLWIGALEEALDVEHVQRLFSQLDVAVGLRAQGHLPTVERLLAEGKTWAEIGQAIGWDGETAKRWYAQESKDPNP